MRMIITSIERNDKHICVIGVTSVGSVKGLWHYNEEPIIGQIYFFELSIGEIDKSEISIFHEEHFCPCVSICDTQVLFRGVCEEIDDVYVVRFSQDWIEMISIENDDYSIRKGDSISFSVSYDMIKIYPYTYD